mmetsp:Transcript_34404/g.76432  ORF Transcript_34404/g.76432 Transcript_34404/m.76432 type:complete len:83 (-) Transcript_34404:448-696(-)
MRPWSTRTSHRSATRMQGSAEGSMPMQGRAQAQGEGPSLGRAAPRVQEEGGGQQCHTGLLRQQRGMPPGGLQGRRRLCPHFL